MNLVSDKIEEVVINMDEMESIKDKFTGMDIAFCCLGTTKADAGSDSAFIKVDHDYVVTFARLAKESGVEHFHVVSSIGAKHNSWFLYMRTKGLMEKHCAELNFKETIIYRPGALKRSNPRRFEKLGQYFMSSIEVFEVGRAMGHFAYQRLIAPSEIEHNVEIWENKKIKKYYHANITN